MKIPFVIDNREYRLADVLNELLNQFGNRSIDIATAYFTVRGFELIKEGLENIGSLRLLLGAEPATGEHIGLRPDTNAIARQLRSHLEAEPFSEATLRLVEDLTAFLRRDSVDVRLAVQGFLHAKCYLIYGDKPSGEQFLFDRFQPLIGIVGSSNLTGPGLTSNRELNLSHRVLLEPGEGTDAEAAGMVSFLSDEKASPRITGQNRQLMKSEVGARAILQLVEWYDREWDEARDFKDDLIELLNASKFGEKVRFPDRELKTVRYDLEAAYRGIYQGIVEAIEGLNLAPYNLESYKKAEVERDVFELGRQEALVGIFKSRYLKRFESSIEAFRISIRRALQFQKTFEDYLFDEKIMDSTDFRRAMQFLAGEDVEDDAMPESLADEMDETEEARAFLDSLPTTDIKDYDLRALNKAIQEDIQSLSDMWDKVRLIKPEDDTKIQRLKSLLTGEMKGKKVIIFSYYKDTARYIERELIKDEASDFRRAAGDPHIRRMDGGNHPGERTAIVQAFAPNSNNRPEIAGTDREIDLLISTDVLSEGQNLQDCAYLINYDLHWNPTRMVQRAGRIDRIGSPFDKLWVYNMFPDEGLEQLLGIVERLSRKISDIDKTGFLDASVLGEAVHPRNFGTLRRIMDEDGAVIEEEEQFIELTSSESMMQEIKDFILAHGKEVVGDLPDGIHSGLARIRDNGLFFYFQAPAPEGGGKLHFWRYYDGNTDRIMDNRFLIAEKIACQPDTPRVISDADVFAIHDKVIDDILRSQQEQQALEEAPKRMDAVQQQMVVILEGLLENPRFKRKEMLDLIKFANAPKSRIQVREFRKLLAEYSEPGKSGELAAELSKLMSKYGAIEPQEPSKQRKKLEREDLRLICFDHVCGG